MLLQSLLLIAPARFSALGELVSQPSDDPQMGPSRYTYSSSPSTPLAHFGRLPVSWHSRRCGTPARIAICTFPVIPLVKCCAVNSPC